jgi:GNAT superfamily N-acetyltransferase
MVVRERDTFRAVVCHHTWLVSRGNPPAAPCRLADLLADWCEAVGLTGASAVIGHGGGNTFELGTVEASNATGAGGYKVNFEAAARGQEVLADRTILLEIPSARLAKGTQGWSWRLLAPKGVKYGRLSAMSTRLLSTVLLHTVRGGAVRLVLRWGAEWVCPETVAPQHAVDAMVAGGLLPDSGVDRDGVTEQWCTWLGVMPRWAPTEWKAGLAHMGLLQRERWMEELGLHLTKGAAHVMRAYLTLTRQRVKGQRPYPVWRRWRTTFPPSLAETGTARQWLADRLCGYKRSVQWDDWVAACGEVAEVGGVITALVTDWKEQTLSSRDAAWEARERREKRKREARDCQRVDAAALAREREFQQPTEGRPTQDEARRISSVSPTVARGAGGGGRLVPERHEILDVGDEEDDEVTEWVSRRDQARQMGEQLTAEVVKGAVTLLFLDAHVGERIWAEVGGDMVIGGLRATSQDVLSFNTAIWASRGKRVRLTRMQVRLAQRRRGMGALVLGAVVEMYKAAGASAIYVTSPTGAGRQFYRKFGFDRDRVSGDWVLQLSETRQESEEAVDWNAAIRRRLASRRGSGRLSVEEREAVDSGR